MVWKRKISPIKANWPKKAEVTMTINEDYRDRWMWLQGVCKISTDSFQGNSWWLVCLPPPTFGGQGGNCACLYAQECYQKQQKNLMSANTTKDLLEKFTQEVCKMSGFQTQPYKGGAENWVNFKSCWSIQVMLLTNNASAGYSKQKSHFLNIEKYD